MSTRKMFYPERLSRQAVVTGVFPSPPRRVPSSRIGAIQHSRLFVVLSASWKYCGIAFCSAEGIKKVERTTVLDNRQPRSSGGCSTHTWLACRKQVQRHCQGTKVLLPLTALLPASILALSRALGRKSLVWSGEG